MKLASLFFVIFSSVVTIQEFSTSGHLVLGVLTVLSLVGNSMHLGNHSNGV